MSWDSPVAARALDNALAIDGELAGVVLPKRYPDEPAEGSIFNLGILPAFRGRGLGRTLHARGLEVLTQGLVSRYVGSTDTWNLSMIRIFDNNGCTRKGTRLLYRASQGVSPRSFP